MTPLLARFLDRLGGLRRAVLLHRRGLAALAAAVAVYVGVQAASAPPARTVPVWTATRDLPGGTVLTADALRRTAFLPGSVPDGTIGSPRQVVGRVLATPLHRGEPVSADAVVGEGWLRGHPGLVAVPVRLTDPAVAALVRAGDHVDLVAADPQHPAATSLLARGAVVLAVPEEPERVGADTLGGRLVVLGVPPAASDTVVSGSVSQFLTVVWSE